ncbi:hypothetical protein ES705_49244 [subsurface metagenome]
MDTELKLYEVTHRLTGEQHFAVSGNAQDACLQAGWLIGDCYVVEQKPLTKYGKHDRATLLVKIPCHVCPYQYAECAKPDDAECPIRPDTTDPGRWQKEVSKARSCPHTGEELGKRNYDRRLKITTLEAAILELSPPPPPTPPLSPEPTIAKPLSIP